MMQPAKKISAIRPGRQDELLAWYAKLPKATRLEVHKAKLQVFRGWLGGKQADAAKAPYPTEELDYLALIAAIAEIKRKIEEPKKEKDFDLRVQKSIAQQKKKKALVQTKIENEFLPLIYQLRCQKPKPMSWRKIADYIRTNHGKTFGVSTLLKVYTAEYGGMDSSDEPETK